MGEAKRVEMVDIEGGEEWSEDEGVRRRRREQGKFEQALSRESFFHYFGGAEDEANEVIRWQTR